MEIKLLLADYQNKRHGADLLMLLNAYALDPMGGGEALSDFTQANLVSSLGKRSDIFTVLCYLDDKPAGLINCIEGFSTFQCQPLLNIHDVVVLPAYRGQGLSQKMFAEVEKIGEQKGCCKLTLEVLQGNKVAQNAYLKVGFAGYELDPQMGGAMFWQKKINH